jgi:PBP1b-binding outer membrane lipoprotein LpoB
MKAIILTAVFLTGCASFSPETEQSISRDRTMNDMAKTALINEMLNSTDPAIRIEGARIAKDFVIPKRSLIDLLVK